MRYRVHYCVENDRLTAEVEATSPVEAVVKFRHTHSDGDNPHGRRSEVLSILPVEAPDAACCIWGPRPADYEEPW